MLKMQKVGKIYMQKIVLQDLNLEVENGRIFGLIGAVGEGKTTLCRMIAGLIPIDEGEIYIDEKSLSRHPEIVRKKLGYVPRQFGRYRDMTCVPVVHRMCILPERSVLSNWCRVRIIKAVSGSLCCAEEGH